MLALETPEFRQAFADYQQWNKAVVDFAEEFFDARCHSSLLASGWHGEDLAD